MTKEQLVKLLVENFKDEYGYVDLSGLNFKDEEIEAVDIRGMKVNGDLYQSEQKVKGDLWQQEQEVSGDLHQRMQKVKGDLEQGEQTIGGYLYQDFQKVGGNQILFGELKGLYN